MLTAQDVVLLVFFGIADAWTAATSLLLFGRAKQADAWLGGEGSSSSARALTLMKGQRLIVWRKLGQRGQSQLEKR